MEKVKIIVGDYGAKNKEGLLKRCESVRSDCDGLFHSGIIHYIQGKMPDFTLKAAISQVLDKCPEVWPEDLPERIDKGEEPKVTKAIQQEFKSLNEGLIMPIEGGEVVEIIRLAKAFLKEGKIVSN